MTEQPKRAESVTPMVTTNRHGMHKRHRYSASLKAEMIADYEAGTKLICLFFLLILMFILPEKDRNYNKKQKHWRHEFRPSSRNVGQRLIQEDLEAEDLALKHRINRSLVSEDYIQASGDYSYRSYICYYRYGRMKMR